MNDHEETTREQAPHLPPPGVVAPYEQPPGPVVGTVADLMAGLGTGTALPRTVTLRRVTDDHWMIDDRATTSPVGRLERYAPYLTAGGAVLAAAVGCVLLFLLVVGLVALVKWGTANALTIGLVVVVLVVGSLVFLGALTRARQARHGGFYR